MKRLFSSIAKHACQFLVALVSGAVALAGGELRAGETVLHEAIDRQIELSFAKWKVNASGKATDAELVRRLHLDLVGKIPYVATTREFLLDKSPDKWPRLVGRLIASDDFARHLAVVLDVMLMERLTGKEVTTDEWRGYLAKSISAGKPLDLLVREILGGDGVDPETRPAAKFYLDRAVEKDALVRDVSRLFLGVDLQCAQCHDHPKISDYLHEHFHGLEVFFAGTKTFKQADGKMVLQEMAMREVDFVSVFKPGETRKTGPRLPGGAALEIPVFEKGEEYVEKPSSKVRAVPKFSLRQRLAEELTGKDTPAFSRNMANRLWALMMGRGLVLPLDMHHSANPPSHPELLDLLAEQLRAMKFDTKAFVRELVLSQTYQRSSEVPEGAQPDAVPVESFAVANMKGLTPEQMFESLLQATESRKVLDEQVETAVKKDPKAYAKLSGDQDKLAAARTAKRAEIVSKFVEAFGGTPGNPEEDFQASLPQALFIANNEIISGWVEPQDGNLAGRLIQMKDASLLAAEACLAILSRQPSPEEIALVEKLLAQPGDHRAGVLEFIWSLLASAEFRFNH
jgi:hypothetical protein